LGKKCKRYVDNPWRYMVFELYMESEVSPLSALKILGNYTRRGQFADLHIIAKSDNCIWYFLTI